MIDKLVASCEAAVAAVHDGATVMIGGFGTAGLPNELTDALIAQGARELTIVNNNAGNGDTGLAALIAAGRVRKVVCSFPRGTRGRSATSRSGAGSCRRSCVRVSRGSGPQGRYRRCRRCC